MISSKRQSFNSQSRVGAGATGAGTPSRKQSSQNKQRRSVSNSGQGLYHKMKILSEASSNAYGSGQLQLNPSDANVTGNDPTVLSRQSNASIGKNIGKAVTYKTRQRPTTSNHQRTMMLKYPRVIERGDTANLKVGSVRAFSNIGHSRGAGAKSQFKYLIGNESVVTTTAGPQSSTVTGVGVHYSPGQLRKDGKATSQALAMSAIGSSQEEMQGPPQGKSLLVQPSVQIEYHGGRIAERLLEITNKTAQQHQYQQQYQHQHQQQPGQLIQNRAQYMSGLGSIVSNSPANTSSRKASHQNNKNIVNLQQRPFLSANQQQRNVRNSATMSGSQQNQAAQMPKNIALQIVPKQQQYSVRANPTDATNADSRQVTTTQSGLGTTGMLGFTNITDSASELTIHQILSGSALKGQQQPTKMVAGLAQTRRRIADNLNATPYDGISAYQSNFSPLNDDYNSGLLTSPVTRASELQQRSPGDRVQNFSSLLQLQGGTAGQNRIEISSQLNQIFQADLAETDLMSRQKNTADVLKERTTNSNQTMCNISPIKENNDYGEGDGQSYAGEVQLKEAAARVMDYKNHQVPETIPELQGQQEISFLEMPRNSGGENEHSSFQTVGTRPVHEHSSQQITLDTMVGVTPREQYIDLEDFNTSTTQIRHRQSLLNMNVDKLKRKKQTKPKVNLDALCFQNGKDYQSTMLGQMRVVNNFDSHLQKSKGNLRSSSTTNHTMYIEVEPSSPSGNALMYDKFVMNDTLTNLENKALLNPAYFVKDPQAFDLRASTKPELVANSRQIKSAYWNPKTHFVLQKKVDDSKTNIYTNTRSFASKYGRGAPHHKIRQQYKKKSDQPQPGYYDTKDAYDKNVGRKLINAVRMDTEMPRGDGLFTGKADENWASLNNKKDANLWKGDHIPQAHVDYAQMISREKGTKGIDVANLAWMFTKTADEIQRAKHNKARQDHIRAQEEKQPFEQVAFDALDMSLEQKAQPFTFDIMQMADCTRIYRTGIEMLGEKIENELKKPDDMP